MKIKNYIIYGIALVASFNVVSCDVLDVDPVDSYSDAAVWGDLALAEAYLNTSYTRIISESGKGSRFASLTDEIYQMHLYGTDNVRQGHVSPDNSHFGWDDDMWNPWNYYYKAIKEVNLFFGKIEEVPVVNDGDDVWKEELTGQAYFLRAFFYNQLYNIFGRIPIIDKTFSIDTEEYTEKRASIEEVTAFIVADCDKAISMLPVTYADGGDFGRATKGAAMALKARTLLFAASPLFDENYPTRSKWEAASAANKAVIDLNAYSLKPVNSSADYTKLFNDPQNPEIIFQKLFDAKRTVGSNQAFLHQSPCGSGNGYGGWGTIQPTHNVVKKFQMADGKPYVQGGEDEYPWADRDLRLEGTIILDGSLWGYGSDKREVEYFVAGEKGVVAGRDSREGSAWWNATQTGYLIKKGLDPDYDDQGTAAHTSPGIMMRLAEFYLNYAECQIELGNNAEALKYINVVRERAQMPPATGADIWADYEYERQIELIFEGQRWFDIRRWKTAEAIYKEPIIGLDIRKMSDGSKKYTLKETPIETRIFHAPKNYWMAIPRSELRKAPSLDAAPYE
ncbi:hypothetical protein M2480_001502 [Parabacteroides sp. PFB2-12]|uniref:RagB/SusD family nutrient uptake outer membrane protein n=1 Tax=unclassified Parabacteroides TaxID=2649774 RepID=UPI002475E4C3|nr:MULTISPECIES: RagB/SusD family nutrient uptake outer membrane protein [unclassified Parabacteroides]MDH6342843.1 hypothetical protein [Parabacteroides sp. PM6-13]MDH6390527.1 hypothetical protein [Parabacteroides sp. PFB2-12]